MAPLLIRHCVSRPYGHQSPLRASVAPTGVSRLSRPPAVRSFQSAELRRDPTKQKRSGARKRSILISAKPSDPEAPRVPDATLEEPEPEPESAAPEPTPAPAPAPAAALSAEFPAPVADDSVPSPQLISSETKKERRRSKSSRKQEAPSPEPAAPAPEPAAPAEELLPSDVEPVAPDAEPALLGPEPVTPAAVTASPTPVPSATHAPVLVAPALEPPAVEHTRASKASTADSPLAPPVRGSRKHSKPPQVTGAAVDLLDKFVVWGLIQCLVPRCGVRHRVLSTLQVPL